MQLEIATNSSFLEAIDVTSLNWEGFQSRILTNDISNHPHYKRKFIWLRRDHLKRNEEVIIHIFWIAFL